MPLYEYKCSDSKCGKLFEELRSIGSRDARINCQKCGAVAAHVLSSFNTLGKRSDNVREPKIRIRDPKIGPRRPAVLRIDRGFRGTVNFWNNRINGRPVGVSVAASSAAKLKMRGNRFKKVSTPIEITDD